MPGTKKHGKPVYPIYSDKDVLSSRVLRLLLYRSEVTFLLFFYGRIPFFYIVFTMLRGTIIMQLYALLSGKYGLKIEELLDIGILYVFV